jgi:hypothetical protein
MVYAIGLVRMNNALLTNPGNDRIESCHQHNDQWDDANEDSPPPIGAGFEDADEAYG